LWLPSECAALGFGTRGLGGATGDDVKGRRDVPTGRGSPVWCVRALAPRRAVGREALASVLRRYESCAEDSAEPVPRARPTTLSASGGGLALVHLGLSSQEPIAPRRIVRAPQPTAPRRLPQLHQTDG